MSVPFYNKQFTFTQPDGTKLKVQGWGDQHHAVFETLDGYTLVENPVTSFYEYAHIENNELKPTGVKPEGINPALLGLIKGARNSREVLMAKVFTGEGLPPGKTRWRARREAAKSQLVHSILSPGVMAAAPKRETIGDYTGLCLLIQFPDMQGTILPGEVEKFCNDKGYNGFNNNGSVYDYFLENSSGKLRYKNIITPYYTAKNPRDYYTNEAIKQPIRAIELIEEALTFHKSNGFDFTQLTSDKLDYVYALNVFYAGPVVNNWAKGLWPHSHHLNSSYLLSPGKFAYDYQITNIGSELTLGTFCHENGHMICDFPDLYDYGYESRGVGVYCLMCAGGVVDEKNPAEVGGYLKYKAGWSDTVTKLVHGLNFAIDSQKNDFFIRDKNRVEYYLIENRTKIGRDSVITDEGLAVWHIDELGDNSNEQMTTISHYECSLIQADNRNDLEHGINDGDGNDLYDATGNSQFGPNTQPQFKWWDGTPTGIEIFNISTAKKVMNFSAR